MANEVTIIVQGQDRGAKQAMQQATEQGEKLGKSVGNVGKIVGGEFLGQLAQGAFQKLTGFLQQSVQAAIESNKAEAQLAARIKSTGGVAGVTAEQVKGMASEFQRLTNFEDDAVVASSNVLLTFTKIGGETFPRAQKAILDMSAALGQDLQSATIQVGKALNDPIKGVSTLARAGVQLTEQQKNQIATMVEAGDVAGAQTVILGELETQFGGSAEAAVAADGGITQMTNSMDDMQEEIGARLLPVLVKWTELKLRLLGVFLALPGPMQAVVAVVGALGLGFLMLAPRIVAARAAMQEMGVSMRTVATRGGGALAAITALVAVVQVIGSQFKAASVDVAGLAKDIERFVETGRVTVEMERLLGTTTDEFVGKLRNAAGSGKDAAGSMERLKQSWDGLLEGIGVDVIQSAQEDLAGFDEALVSVVNSGVAADDVLQGLIEQYGLTDEQVQLLLSSVPQFRAELDRTAEAQTDAAAATDAHTESLQDFADQLRAQVDPAFALIKAQEELKEAQEAVTEAERDHGRRSPEYRAALRAEAKAALDVLSAAGELGDEFTGDLSAAQRKMLRDAGFSEEGIEQLAADLRRAKRDADRLDGTRVRVEEQHTITTTRINRTIVEQFGVNAPQIRAHGGITGAEVGSAQSGGIRSGMTLVGEQGPELVDLAPGSFVHPAGATRTMLSAGGGPTVVELVIRGDGTSRAAFLVDELRHSIRTNTTLRRELAEISQ